MIFVKEIQLNKSWPEALLQLHRLPGFKLLHSGERHGLYDIVVFRPQHRFILSDSHALPNFITSLKEAMPLLSLPSDFPFVGGLLGYFSYDVMLSSTKKMPTPFESLPLADVGLYDGALIWNHHTQQLNWVSAFKSRKALLLEEIFDCLQAPAPVLSSVVSDFRPLMSRLEYDRAFDAIKAALQRGQIYQANLTQPYLARYEGEAFEIYRQVCALNPMPYGAYFSGEVEILSFSPERFVTIEHERMMTSPIKGTIKRSAFWDEDEALKQRLRGSEKNRAENVMIVDLMRNDMGKIAKAGTVHVEALCDVKSFQNVHHLVSDISASLKEGLHPLDAFIRVFPGGSITGAPKLEAMKVIESLEPYRRGVYCGSLFYLSCHGRLDSNIAIRSLLAKDHHLHLAAGGGIVMDSEVEDEYQECNTKISAILSALMSAGSRA